MVVKGFLLDNISDSISQEDIENTSFLFIDESTNVLEASSPGETPYGAINNALNSWHLPSPSPSLPFQSETSFLSQH